MKASDIIVDALEANGITQKELADQMGKNYKTLARWISENRLTAQRFVDIAAELGYAVVLVERNCGEELKVRVRGTGPRVRRMVNGITYDTAKADALCHSDVEDGRYMEVYRDQEGRYFIVHYSLWQKEAHTITPCGEEEARHLAEKYSDSLFSLLSRPDVTSA